MGGQESQAPDPSLEDVEEELTDDDFEIPEPSAASRVSPYAVAALVVGLLGLYLSGQAVVPFLPLVGKFVWWLLPTLLPPLGAAVIAIWLSARAEDEIHLSSGKLGGIGYFKAARVVAALTITILVVGTVTRVALNDSGEDSESGYIEAPPPEEELGEFEEDSSVVEFLPN